MTMTFAHQVRNAILTAVAVLVGGAIPGAWASQKDSPAAQLPSELRGAKVYNLPEETKPGQAMENPVIYRNLSYQDINFQRLVLALSLSVKPVDRAATVRRIYFQDIRANGIPVHVETFDKEFKLSKKDIVDLPAPLQSSIVFSELESLKSVKEIVDKDKILITGQSFIDVKLNVLEKVALRAKQLVIPVTLNEEVPLNMFSGNPLLQMAASRILDTLSDPSSTAAIALAKERVAKLTEDRTLASAGQPAIFLLYCEYSLLNPKSQAAEKFSQSGTGFLVSGDGKLLTAKRVVQPWKFDPQIAFLMARYKLELDAKSYRLCAWPAGVQVVSPDGQLNFQAALRSENQTLSLLKTAPDRMEKRDYQDPDSGERATLSLHAEGENDIAVLQLTGTSFQPLAFAESGARPGPDVKTALFGFPFGLSQAQSNPQLVSVRTSSEGSMVTLDHILNPGESGAPLLTPNGKVFAFAGSGNQCIPIEIARTFIQ
jgi:S1-C subfamily serine protease